MREAVAAAADTADPGALWLRFHLAAPCKFSITARIHRSGWRLNGGHPIGMGAYCPFPVSPLFRVLWAFPHGTEPYRAQKGLCAGVANLGKATNAPL